jgi:hypothetical protein
LLRTHFSCAGPRYIRSRRRLQPSRQPAPCAIGGHVARSTWLHPRSAWCSTDFATFESTALELLEFSMKKLSFVLGVAGMVASLAAGAAVSAKLLGEPVAPEQAERTIVITPTTKYVNVTEGDVVKFVANGTAFAWNFDSPPEISSFELNRVAPAGALDHRVTVYVARNVELYD